ncbi:MAG: glycosyltransferase [Thermoleophilaceae bacterium]|nr:glycosyltransferase [Thermoleophilaceae bacterium]
MGIHNASRFNRNVPESDIALVHDYLLTMRGAERTFAEMAALWPISPIYTSLFDDEAMTGRFEGHDVHTSSLQRLGVGQSKFRSLLPLFPKAFEHLSLAGKKLVISSSSAFAHGVRPDADATHICYCHSPFRYVWHEFDTALSELPATVRAPLRATLRRIRAWDKDASDRVTHYVANSEITRYRIADCYGRDATVIHPPVDTERFGPPESPEDYVLYVGELASHKRVEVAIQAAKKARRKLRIVGAGPEKERLQAIHGDNVDFLGRVSDIQLTELYARAEALIVPNIEEFGITAVEAQGAGRPVLALGRGGARETVLDGVTGVLVPKGDVDQFAEALAYTNFQSFEASAAVKNAERFSSTRFRREFKDYVEQVADR